MTDASILIWKFLWYMDPKVPSVYDFTMLVVVFSINFTG